MATATLDDNLSFFFLQGQNPLFFVNLKLELLNEQLMFSGLEFYWNPIHLSLFVYVEFQANCRFNDHSRSLVLEEVQIIFRFLTCCRSNISLYNNLILSVKYLLIVLKRFFVNCLVIYHFHSKGYHVYIQGRNIFFVIGTAFIVIFVRLSNRFHYQCHYYFISTFTGQA